MADELLMAFRLNEDRFYDVIKQKEMFKKSIFNGI